MCKAFPANKTGGVNILTGLAYVSNLQTRKVIAEGEERGNQWTVVRCEDSSSSTPVGQQQTGSSSPICSQGNDGRGRLWCQVYNPLMPDLTAGGRENRLEVRPDLGGSPICYPALPRELIWAGAREARRPPWAGKQPLVQAASQQQH